MVIEENRVFILNIRNNVKKDISENFIKNCQHFKNQIYLMFKEYGIEILNLNVLNKSIVNNHRKVLTDKEIVVINKIKSSKYYSTFKSLSENLCSVIRQQLIKQVLNEYKSYFAARKKNIKSAKLPKAKKLDKINNFSISFMKNNFTIKNNRLILTLNKNLKLKFSLPKYFLKKKITSIRIVKKLDEYELHIVYKEKINFDNLFLNENILTGIDLGLDNLATIFSNNPNIESLIISGKEIKSFNQWFNKLLAKLKSLRDKANNEEDKKKYNYQIRKLYRYRNRRLKSLFHLISTRIIEYCLTSKSKYLIVSRDILSSKNGINLGKKNNQNFVSIPFKILLEQLKYKAKNTELSIKKLMRVILLNQVV